MPNHLSLALRSDMYPLQVKALCGEPVRFPVPLPIGFGTDPLDVSVHVGDSAMPSVTQVTSRYPNGHPRWLLVDTELTAASYRDPISCEVGVAKCFQDVPTDPCSGGAMFAGDGDSVRWGDTLAVGRSPNAICLGIKDTEILVWVEVVNAQGQTYDMDIQVVEVVERNALRMQVAAKGRGMLTRLYQQGPSWELRITSFRDRPFVYCDFQILNMTYREQLSLSQVTLRLRPVGPQYLGTRSHLHRHPEPESVTVADSESLRLMGHFMSADDIWATWEAVDGGVALSVRHWLPNYPKRLHVGPAGYALDLFPAGDTTWALHRGQSKTHEFCIQVFGTSNLAQVPERHRLFTRPVCLSVPPQHFAVAGVMGNRFFAPSRTYPGMESTIADLLMNRPLGMGMMSFGDEPTVDGQLWMNNEYDMVHLLLIEYARTQERPFLELARVSAQHWLDVDLVRFDPDPWYDKGLASHTTNHREPTYVGPSHQWVEGFLGMYHFTGDQRFLDAAIGVGHNVIYHLTTRFGGVGGYQSRELGWALRALVALYQETGIAEFRIHADQVVQRFQQWRQFFGMLEDDGSGFIAVVGVAVSLYGLIDYYSLTRNDAVADMVVTETDALLEHNLAVHTQLLYHGSYLAGRFHDIVPYMMLEPFAFCFRHTGERRYLELGIRTIQYGLWNGHLRFTIFNEGIEERGDVVFQKVSLVPTPGQYVGLAVKPLLAFLEVADDAGVLKEADFRV
jgi:hypothetical protein